MGAPEGWERFIRHSGMLTLEQQERISNTTVAIGGVGGIGGAVAMLCAKSGFGHLILCDFDRYELVNLVEQMFATLDTVGQDKTQAAAAEIKRHAPECRITSIQREIRTQDDADLIIRGADVVVSGVDNILARIYLSRAAERLGVPFFIPANIGWSVFHTTKATPVAPYEKRLLDLPGIKVSNGRLDLTDSQTCLVLQADWDAFIAVMSGYDEETTLSILKGKIKSYPYMAFPAFFAASYCAAEIVKYVAFGADTIRYYGDVFAFNMRWGKPIDWKDNVEKARRLVEAFVSGGRNAMVARWIEMSHVG